MLLRFFLSKKSVLLLFTGFILIILLISYVPTSSDTVYIDRENINKPKLSASLEGSENVLITEINRQINFSGYGLINIADALVIKNSNNNPLSSIFFGIPLINSGNLIYFEAHGKDNNSLLCERSYMVMNDYELIAIYFNSPLLPLQSENVKFLQTYKNLLNYNISGTTQFINFTGNIYPTLPYKARGNIAATFNIPDTSSFVVPVSSEKSVTIKLSDISSVDHLEPFLANLGVNQNFTISFSDSSVTKMEILELTRELFISPWSIIRVKEDISIQNKGLEDISELSLSIPGLAKNLLVSDDLGEVLGTTVEAEKNYTVSDFKKLTIDLSQNRITIIPNSKYKFTIQYYLPFEKYYSINWLQESIKINILTSTYEYLGNAQTIKIIIDGCYKIDFNSEPPDAIESSQSTVIMVYKSDYVSPLEKRIVQFTFTIDLFNILLRPIVFVLLLISLMSGCVLIIKTRKEEKISVAIKKELIPVNEIREYCSLYEEKNALIFEIRQAEEDAKRKKIVKKKYKNILDKNAAKIEEIQKEITPFKEIILDVGETFNKILKNIDVLDAERTSINDSINLLEMRYKRGRLPSKAAYEKLTDNFLNRRNKIDRSIDKSIQQLRSYLL